MLSFPEIGAAAMMSRACAGTIARTAVFSLPGSENAVRLAMLAVVDLRPGCRAPRRRGTGAGSRSDVNARADGSRGRCAVVRRDDHVGQVPEGLSGGSGSCAVRVEPGPGDPPLSSAAAARRRRRCRRARSRRSRRRLHRPELRLAEHPERLGRPRARSPRRNRTAARNSCSRSWREDSSTFGVGLRRAAHAEHAHVERLALERRGPGRNGRGR